MMERLTVPDKKIDGGYQRAVIDTREVKKYAMNIYWELKKYEDIELTPEQIISAQGNECEKPYFYTGMMSTEREGG